jgi:ABC-type branched-subunit amino acid transport system permease subunit
MAGYVSFGQVAFFGFGAYAGALLMLAGTLAWPLGRIMLRSPQRD